MTRNGSIDCNYVITDEASDNDDNSDSCCNYTLSTHDHSSHDRYV